jgi:hypothetical protein
MKSKEEFEISKNNCTNINELIDLSKSYYTEGDIINKVYLEWQYLKNPLGKPFLFTSRESKSNELAGQYLVVPLNFTVGNEIIKGSLSLNTLTRPKFQGKGLFTKMAKATYEDCMSNNAYLTIGFPNPQSYPGFVRKLDFEHLGDIPLLIKPLKYVNMVFSYFKKNKKKHGGSININPSKIKNSNIKCLDFNEKEIEAKYNQFWNTIKKQYKLSIDKDFTFLKWRYDSLPTRVYKIFYFEENGEIKGIIILRAEHVWGFDVGLIMDFLVIDGDKSIGKELLNFSKKILKETNLDFITALHNDSYEYEILKKAGYYKISQKLLPQKIHFIVRLNKDFSNSKMLFQFKNWKLTFGDYDIF